LTNDPKAAKAVLTFFERQLMPLASELKSSGVPLLVSGFEPEAPTYYVTRRKQSMARRDFEWGGCQSVAEFPEQLAALWRQQGHSRLAELAPAIGRLAVALKQRETANDDVSAFIYVMY
jgi:hypothetical protein